MEKSNHNQFLEFIEEESKQDNFNNKAFKDLLNKVPFQYHNFVENTINTIYKGDVEKYKKTIPLFLKLFTREDKAYAESSVISNKKNFREVSKKRKQAILWAGQLLRTVGGRNMTAIAPFAVINDHLKDVEEQNKLCRKSKLMNSSGKMVRFTTPEQRKIERNADNFKRIKAMEKMADELNYKFIFLTITLPPNFHPNPSMGRFSYSGIRPQEALDTLNHFWALIRTNLNEKGLSAGDDFFGVWVKEGNKDSCIHKHCMLFVDPKKIKIYQNVFETVCRNERIRLAKKYGFSVKKYKLKWDFKIERNNSKEGKKAKASSYLFKYLSPDINNKETLANDSLFSAYGSRRIQFFGEDSKISVFRHLVRNWKEYEEYIEDKDVVQMLMNKDLYTFNTKYKDDFKNISVKVDGKRKYLGVSYIPGRRINGFLKKEILVEKKQYIIIENQDKAVVKKYSEEMKGLTFDNDLDLYNSNLSNAVACFPKAQKKQNDFNDLLVEYYKNQALNGIDTFIPVAKCFFTETSEEVIKDYFGETLENQKKNFELNFEDEYFKLFHGIKKESEIELDLNTELLLLTLKHHYSSKNPSGFCKSEENTKIPIIEEDFEVVLN